MKALIIEDEKSMAKILASLLKKQGFAVDISYTGKDGAFKAMTNSYDLIVSDIILPDINGDEVIAKIRKDGKTTPIIVVSVKDCPIDRARYLDLGADDCIKKPFSAFELFARFKALARRPRTYKDEELVHGDLKMNISRFEVFRGDEKIRLTNKEFSLLHYLILNQGRICSRELIMENVWDENVDPFSNTVETHILRLRRKIEIEGYSKIIHSIVGRGYKLEYQGGEGEKNKPPLTKRGKKS